jgi:hypothetical protein
MSSEGVSVGLLPAYNEWVDLWTTTKPSAQSNDECLRVITTNAPQWLQEQSKNSHVDRDQLENIIACFKAAARAKLIPLGGKVPPSSVEWDVLSECHDSGIDCSCEGLYPAPSDVDVPSLERCGCKAIERTIQVGKDAITKEDEWNNSTLFSGKKLVFAMTELNPSNADEQPPPYSCAGPGKNSRLPKVRARREDPHSLTTWMILSAIQFTRHKSKSDFAPMPNTFSSCPVVQVSLARVLL